MCFPKRRRWTIKNWVLACSISYLYWYRSIDSCLKHSWWFCSFEQCSKYQSLSGIASGLPIAGIGTVKWSILMDSGMIVDLYVRNTLYVLNCPIRLLSPQQIAQQTQRASDGFYMQAKTWKLMFDGHIRTVLLDQTSNLPILYIGATESTSAPPISGTCPKSLILQA